MRRMDSRNGVLTSSLNANGQKSEANGQVMDSEWTANGQRMDGEWIPFIQPFRFNFVCISVPIPSYPGNPLAPEQKCAEKLNLHDSNECEFA